MFIKKYLALISILCVLVVMFPQANAKAASEFDSDSNIAAGVIATAGTGATYETDLSAVPILGPLFATDPEDFGQDLYKTIYERVKTQGSAMAMSRTILQTSLSQEQLKSIGSGSNINELLGNESGENLAVGEAARRLRAFESQLAEEKKLADLFVETSLEVEPTEIFANGNERDSGFDLISDLEIIDQILFGRTESVPGTSGPGSPAGSDVVGPGAGGTGEEESTVSGADSGTSGAAEGAGAANGAEPELLPEDAAIMCPLNEDFNSAVARFRAEESAQESSGEQGIARDRSGAGGVVAEEAATADEETIFPEEEPADWQRLLPCTETFCLTAEVKYKTESSYLPNANCIACHFEKINDAFKKTLDHNLVPSKATGNLIEAPKCKIGLLGGLKFNIIILPQPIVTPPNDDLVVKGDFIKNAIDFYEKYYDNPGRCTDGSVGGACKADPNKEAEIAAGVIERAQDNQTQDDILREIRSQVAVKKEEAVRLIRENRMTKDAQNQTTQFGVMMQEIKTFNGYFGSFVDLFETIVSPEADKPCKLLIAKPNCS